MIIANSIMAFCSKKYLILAAEIVPSLCFVLSAVGESVVGGVGQLSII